jgi:hypothetical protein
MSSGKVEASIPNIVNDLPAVSWQQIIYEAITNAIQAKATEIKINFVHNDNTLDIGDKFKYITAITIEDNGEGFTEQNTNSFKEYRTSLKKNLGCKGIGRFLFLKEFDEIKIESLDKKIKFVIDSDIKVDNLLNEIDKTIIYFTQPKRKFEINYSLFDKDIKDHFIAYFKLLNDKNCNINIEVYENMDIKFKIHSQDIPPFETREFKIDTHKFKMSYLFNNEEFQKEGFYCAGHRVVKKNSDLEDNRRFKLFKGFNILYLLEGSYLDNNINDTRDHFIINPKRIEKDLFHNLSWDTIQQELREQIKIIAKENGLDIEKLSMENLKEAIEKKPYLGLYLKQNENFLDTETLVSHAEQALKKDKESLRKHIHKLNKEEFYEKLSFVTQTELAEYMYDRQKLIDKLKELTNDNSIEAEIHNLFMRKGTEDSIEDYKTNALWLFDDRFMSYNKIFSDKRIKDIFPKLSDNLDRPDLLSVISNTENKNDITDVVIIELKRADKSITPAGAEEQLLKYARYINDAHNNNPIRIWCYAFLKFDKDTVYSLEDKDYNQIPTHSEYPIYYKYHEKRNTIINFLDYKAIAFDADTRHKTFMKILRGETL